MVGDLVLFAGLGLGGFTLLRRPASQAAFAAAALVLIGVGAYLMRHS